MRRAIRFLLIDSLDMRDEDLYRSLVYRPKPMPRPVSPIDCTGDLAGRALEHDTEPRDDSI